MKNIEIDKVVTHALPLSNVSDCIKDCLKLAIEEWRIITLTANSMEYTIDPDKLYDLVYETKEEKEED